MTILLTLVLLPLASCLLAAVLALRDGGNVAWEWVRILLVLCVFLLLMIRLGDTAIMATACALALVVVLQVAGFHAWRQFGVGVPVDEP